MRPYQTIIFDLDGTLADTSEGIYNCIRYAQKNMNLPPITDVQMRSHIGPPMHESYERNFHLTGTELELAVGYHKEYALTKGLYETSLYDGVPRLLSQLKSLGSKLAVATLKYEETAQKMLSFLNIASFFDVICGTLSEVKLTKAQLLLKCVDLCQGEKGTALLVGDSSYDALGAQEAGIDFLGVTYGFGFLTKEDVNQYTNIGCAGSPIEIISFIS
ncbi:MAG: HAD hydrolase-like protein [Bacteroidales bacterium]|nr:HAD hydrolase-like protein [Bacteroidales bacterium]